MHGEVAVEHIEDLAAVLQKVAVSGPDASHESCDSPPYRENKDPSQQLGLGRVFWIGQQSLAISSVCCRRHHRHCGCRHDLHVAELR
jgi:hypothetical protein